MLLTHAYVHWLADPDCYRDRQYIPAVLLPHSLCRWATANAPANRQMPIALVVSGKAKKMKTDCM